MFFIPYLLIKLAPIPRGPPTRPAPPPLDHYQADQTEQHPVRPTYAPPPGRAVPAPAAGRVPLPTRGPPPHVPALPPRNESFMASPPSTGTASRPPVGRPPIPGRTEMGFSPPMQPAPRPPVGIAMPGMALPGMAFPGSKMAGKPQGTVKVKPDQELDYFVDKQGNYR